MAPWAQPEPPLVLATDPYVPVTPQPEPAAPTPAAVPRRVEKSANTIRRP
jgi:hypothetical protein